MMSRVWVGVVRCDVVCASPWRPRRQCMQTVAPAPLASVITNHPSWTWQPAADRHAFALWSGRQSVAQAAVGVESRLLNASFVQQHQQQQPRCGGVVVDARRSTETPRTLSTRCNVALIGMRSGWWSFRSHLYSQHGIRTVVRYADICAQTGRNICRSILLNICVAMSRN